MEVSSQGEAPFEVSSKASEASQPPSLVKVLKKEMATEKVDSEQLDVLHRLSIWSRNLFIPDRVLVTAKRNYKFYAEVGLPNQYMVGKFSVLDTGAGPKFVVKSLLHRLARSRI